MAKKSRTPAPPRKVQTPQRRTDPKRSRSPEDRRFLMMTIAFAASGVVAVVVVALYFFVFSGKNSTTTKIPNSSAQRIGGP